MSSAGKLRDFGLANAEFIAMLRVLGLYHATCSEAVLREIVFQVLRVTKPVCLGFLAFRALQNFGVNLKAEVGSVTLFAHGKHRTHAHSSTSCN